MPRLSCRTELLEIRRQDADKARVAIHTRRYRFLDGEGNERDDLDLLAGQLTTWKAGDLIRLAGGDLEVVWVFRQRPDRTSIDLVVVPI